MANSVQVMKMCSAFAGACASVDLLARRAPASAGTDIFAYYGVDRTFNVQHVWYPEGWRGRSWIYAIQAGLHARWLGADVAYCRCPFSALAAMRLGIPSFYEAHDVPATGSNRDRFVLPAMFRHPRFLGVCVITAALGRELLSRYALRPEFIHVAPDGADPVKPVSDSLRLRREGRICAGYVGQLYPGKGMETILPLARLCPETDFHVVGGTEELIAQWRSRADGVPNLFFHGYVRPEQTGRYIAAFDVVLAPLQSRVSASGGEDIAAWTSPLKIFEYMSHGQVIIASDIPVLHEVLKAGKNCLMAKPDNVSAWGAALTRLREDSMLCKQLRAQAQSDFDENYTWRIRAQRIVAFMQAQLKIAD